MHLCIISAGHVVWEALSPKLLHSKRIHITLMPTLIGYDQKLRSASRYIGHAPSCLLFISILTSVTKRFSSTVVGI